MTVQVLKKIPVPYIVARAKEIHAELLSNANQEPKVFDFHLEKEADEIHAFMFGNVPSKTFRDYVNSIHTHLKSPNWLAGRLGVPYISD